MRKIFLWASALTILTTGCFHIFGQTTGEITKQIITKPVAAQTLSDFVPALFPEISVDQTEPVLVDNNPAVRFDVFRDGRRNEMLLVAHRKQIILYGIVREKSPTALPEDSLKKIDDAPIWPTPDIAGCGGLSSSGNPYPCCSNGGNCTWFAWYRSNIVFNSINSGNGFGNTNFGDAKTWASKASQSGFPVSSESCSRCVGVNSNMSSFGHVFFVEIQRWQNKLDTSEMQCYQYYGPKWSVLYDRSKANLGYIYPKAATWRPRVDVTVSTTLWAGSRPASILFSGANFTTDTIVDIVTPDGSSVSISGTQLNRTSSTALWVYPVLNARGYWKFKVVGKDGQRSNWVYLYVN